MKVILKKILEKIKKRPFEFATYWLLIFFILVSLSLFMGILEEKDEELVNNFNTNLNEIIPANPLRVVIDKVGIEVNVNSPESRNISILDESLKSGAVHYPGSGLIGSKNNVFIFGHSSNLPVVLNKNFKAFNDLEDLIVGDIVRVETEEMEFIYEIIDVKEADAEDFRVDFNTNKRMLTLSTCNTFGDLNDRFIVQAELIGTRNLKI